MAIAIENASIGTPYISDFPAATTAAITTNVTCASGATVIIAGASDTLPSGLADNSGNGYTWTVDVNRQNGPYAWIASCYCASGLASGTVITATWAASINTRMMDGFSYTGGAAASRLDQTTSRTAFGEGAGWTTGSITPTVSGSIVVGVYLGNGDAAASQSSTPTAGWTEFADGGITNQWFTGVYQIVADTTARNPGGTLALNSGAPDQAGVTANYKAGAGGTDATVTAAVSTATAAVVAPPLPRPTPPFTEINVRM